MRDHAGDIEHIGIDTTPCLISLSQWNQALARRLHDRIREGSMIRRKKDLNLEMVERRLTQLVTAYGEASKRAVQGSNVRLVSCPSSANSLPYSDSTRSVKRARPGTCGTQNRQSRGYIACDPYSTYE